VKAHRTLRAAHKRAFVEDEFTAHWTLERSAAQHGEQFLFERPVK
jgi:hypothetical protein